MYAPLYLTYRTYKVYMGRIDDEQRHVRQTAETSALHLATIQALAGAIDVAHRVGGELGHQLTTTAQHAFDSGVTITAAIGALLMVSVTIAAAIGLRKVPRATKESQQERPGH